jgi:cell wall-associated NlpC family hydrolase
MILRPLIPTLLGSALLAHVPTGPLAAQDVTADAVAWRTDDTRTGWRIGIGVPGQGALSTRLHVRHQSHGGSGYRDNGVGVDLTLFERRRQGIYIVAGLGAGTMDPDGPGAINSRAYWDWSAGLGYELVPISFFALRGEGRWRTQRPGPEEGLELSVGAVVRLRASRAPRQRAVTEERRMNAPTEGRVVDLARAEGISGDKAQLVADVVATATAAMGTPYQWGGTGSGGGGFDCSGLIQYAYRQHGIQLPRISRDQARVGVAVDKSVEALAPGDILTFSNSGGHVTHVALYVGEGKIIHSASGGVQMSLLSPTDSYGKWWWNRWVGARRVVR